VLEIPPADGGSITGTIMDAWQAALEDVGPAGVDKGKGGKYLILPPGYKNKSPKGYIALPSMTYQGYAVLRSILKSGSDADVASAVTYAKRIQLYPLSQADNPPGTVFVDVVDVLYDATIPYDVRFFESLNRIVQAERNLQVAFALAAYKKDKGSYPEKLADLAPKYLKEVPGDLFAGKPLVYKPSKDGYLFYSVGANGRDDGGALDEQPGKGVMPGRGQRLDVGMRVTYATRPR
jgi:hypothetical protein